MTQSGVAVLMYHALLEQPHNELHRVHILQSSFAQQMNWLAEQGYRTLGLTEVMQRLRNHQSLPERSVVLTFDDGYYSLYKFAKPLLSRLGFVATLFVCTDLVGKSTYAAEAGFSAAGYPDYDRPLTWAELGEMARTGWEIEAHSCSHPYLSRLEPGQLDHELGECKQAIEEQLGQPVRYLAYPFGDYNREVLAAVKKAGYAAAFSVHNGKLRGGDWLRLPRIEINNEDRLEDFERKVETGFASIGQKWRATVRGLAYASPTVKDWLQTTLR